MSPPNPSTKQQRLWQRGKTYAAQRQWLEAARCFKTIAEHEPSHVPALLMATDVLLQLDKYREARQCILQACLHGSRYPNLAVGIGRRLRHFNDTQRLHDFVANAQTDKPGDSATLTELASLVSSVGDHLQARALIELAVRADPTYAQARYLHGVIAMFHGDTDQARFELEACIQIAPGFAQAHWVMSSLEHLQGQVDDRVERIRVCLAKVTPSTNAEAYLSFALHNELHACGRYDEAWQALQHGCAVQRRLVPYDRQDTVELFSKVKSLCTRMFVEPLPRSDDYTPIFIIGMHRSGTTLLERILAGHSLVADGGESYAFTAQLDLAADHKSSGALDLVSAERLANADFDAIGSGFIDASRWRAQGKPFMTEKLPPNLVNAGFIAKALPDAKILHMVRDPADTCFSNLRTYFTRTAAYSYDQLQLADYHGQYRELMRHWHAVMPGRILDVSYDDLITDTEASARRIFAFCGMSFEAQTLAIDRQAGAVSTASTATVRKGILANRGAAWKPYQGYLQPLLDRLNLGK